MAADTEKGKKSGRNAQPEQTTEQGRAWMKKERKRKKSADKGGLCVTHAPCALGQPQSDRERDRKTRQRERKSFFGLIGW